LLSAAFGSISDTANNTPRRVQFGLQLFGRPIMDATSSAVLLLAFFVSGSLAAQPVVSNVRSAARPGSQVVDIRYDLAYSGAHKLAVTVLVSAAEGAASDLPASTFSGPGYGSGVAPGKDKQITWDAAADAKTPYSGSIRFRVIASEIPSGMVWIPAGPFTMGDTFDDGDPNELPPHQVFVSAFYMERYDVTKSVWDSVYPWAVEHGYSFDNEGLGKAANHPVHSVDWYDAVKWCNARSEKEGLTPAYYTSPSHAAVYRSRQIDLSNASVDWSANGYRLPTAAEWEKAARGGAANHRFPWTDTDTISHSRANYYSSGRYSYDVSPTRGYHPTFNDGKPPFTSPVGYFPPNGYGLYDMVGNIWQWCWDRMDGGWYRKPGATEKDTRGPDSSANGSHSRMMRGGSFHRFAFNVRNANLSVAGDSADFAFLVFGFRCVRSF
jgi:formylglycine-generating enzyme required for sulfatase activity